MAREPTLSDRIDEAIRTEMRDNHIPGAAVVVVQSGRVLHSRGYGVEVAGTERTVSVDETVFRLGSISKALTSLALTRVVERGAVSWDDPVGTFVNGIQNPRGFKEPVRVRNLVTHTGGFDQIGLDRQIGAFDKPLAERTAMRPSLRAFLEAGNLRRTAPAGTRFRYDTYGIVLAGLVLEETTGLPFPEAMRRELFAPLGMTRSFVEVDDAHRDRLAIGHGYINGEYRRMPYEVYVTTPASSIDTTAADMGRLLVALTTDGSNASGRWVAAATLQSIWDGQFRPHPEFHGGSHGFWEQISVTGSARRAELTFEHGGSMLGFSNWLAIVPELNVGIFVTANRNREAGGPRVRLDQIVNPLVVDWLRRSEGPTRAPAPYPVPKNPIVRDASRYAGTYYYGIYCKTCSAEELERGAWPRGRPTEVTAHERGLSIRGDLYVADDEPDVFVRADGERRVFFGNGPGGHVAFFLWENTPETFERELTSVPAREDRGHARVQASSSLRLRG
ncbi:MAG: serine hydrolase domain-containing protein [Myxococcota bacterium]